MISIFIVRDCSCWTRFLSRYPLTGINQRNPYALSAVEVADEKKNKEFELLARILARIALFRDNPGTYRRK